MTDRDIEEKAREQLRTGIPDNEAKVQPDSASRCCGGAWVTVRVFVPDPLRYHQAANCGTCTGDDDAES